MSLAGNVSNYEELLSFTDRACFVCPDEVQEALLEETNNCETLIASELNYRDPRLKIPPEREIISLSNCERHLDAFDVFYKFMRSDINLSVVEALKRTIAQLNTKTVSSR